jgi:mono/diheme cytochrome c family protein
VTRHWAFLLACGMLMLGLASFAGGCASASVPPTATTAPSKPAATSVPAATAAPATVAPTKPAATPASTTAPVAAATTAPAKAVSPGATLEAESGGQELFETNCVACHGPDGAGGLKIGTATSADLRSPHLETLYNNSDDLISRAVLQGKDQQGEDLDPTMPHWQGKLSQQQVSQIISYLKTLH